MLEETSCREIKVVRPRNWKFLLHFSEYEDRINDVTDAEVLDSYLRTLPKVILWKLR